MAGEAKNELCTPWPTFLPVMASGWFPPPPSLTPQTCLQWTTDKENARRSPAVFQHTALSPGQLPLQTQNTLSFSFMYVCKCVYVCLRGFEWVQPIITTVISKRNVVVGDYWLLARLSAQRCWGCSNQSGYRKTGQSNHSGTLVVWTAFYLDHSITTYSYFHITTFITLPHNHIKVQICSCICQ